MKAGIFVFSWIAITGLGFPSLAQVPGAATPAAAPVTPTANPSPMPSLPAPLTSTPTLIATPPADFASLTAKEILSANNQVVSHLAVMYQTFGVLITIIVTLVGGIATYLSYAARKNVAEFLQDWTKKMEVLEDRMKASSDRIDEATAKAEKSAAQAAKSAQEAGRHEQSMKDSVTIAERNLKDIEEMRAQAGVPAATEGLTPSVAVSEGLVVSDSTEALDSAEDAAVAKQLKGKINPAETGESPS